MMFFSKNKERLLASLYPKTGNHEIAKILGLSASFVQRKAEELGLEKEEIIEWTENEIKLVIELYPCTSNRGLSGMLGRTKMEIDHFAFRLGLSKSPEYFSEITVSSSERQLVESWNKEYNIKELGNSKGNYVLGRILDYMFPLSQIFREYPIGNLRLDLYVPMLSMGFEFDGVQHSQFNKFFHKSTADFIRAQNRDYEKSNMCESLGIVIVRFAHDEDLSIPLVRAKIEEVV